MKTLSIAILAFVLFAGCQKSGQNRTENTRDAAAMTTNIEVNTIKCDLCVKTVTDALKKVDGVQGVSVSLEKKIATVQYLPAKVTVASLENAIAQAGYDANNTKRNDVAYRALDACCQ